MAPLALELKKYDNIESIVCVTAQHRQMLDQVLEIFGITPDYDLDIMKTRQSLIGITTRVLEGLDEVIKKEQPDIVLVHGDTSTSFVAALAAFYNQVKVGHVDFDNKRVIIVTAHRRENLGKPLENICNALKQIVTEYEDVELVYPVHLNPAVRETAFGILGDMDRVHLIDPLDVEELHNAMSRSFMVMTDSGGIQEEAPALAKPVLVLRKETERPEAVAAGTVKIAGVEKDDIVRLAKELLDSEDAYNKMAHAANPYGDGEASRRTVEAILYSDKRPENFSVK